MVQDRLFQLPSNAVPKNELRPEIEGALDNLRDVTLLSVVIHREVPNGGCADYGSARRTESRLLINGTYDRSHARVGRLCDLDMLRCGRDFSAQGHGSVFSPEGPFKIALYVESFFPFNRHFMALLLGHVFPHPVGHLPNSYGGIEGPKRQAIKVMWRLVLQSLQFPLELSKEIVAVLKSKGLLAARDWHRHPLQYAMSVSRDHSSQLEKSTVASDSATGVD